MGGHQIYIFGSKLQTGLYPLKSCPIESVRPQKWSAGPRASIEGHLSFFHENGRFPFLRNNSEKKKERAKNNKTKQKKRRRVWSIKKHNLPTWISESCRPWCPGSGTGGYWTPSGWFSGVTKFTFLGQNFKLTFTPLNLVQSNPFDLQNDQQDRAHLLKATCVFWYFLMFFIKNH